MKVMICQKVLNKTSQEINEERKKITKQITENFKNIECNIIDAFPIEIFDDLNKRKITNIPLKFLSEAIELMQDCNLYFGEDWEESRECRLINLVAKNYNLNIFYYKGE